MTLLKIIKTDETKNMIDFEELISGQKITLMKSDFEAALKSFVYWQKDVSATNFTTQLFNLICHADDVNKIKFLKGFPEETVIWLLWYTHKGGEQGFYDEYINKKTEGSEVENGNED